jgi:two-component system nitrogen regulation response regulator GlnG/two-component system response regulator HydG
MTNSTVSEWALPWEDSSAPALPQAAALSIAWFLEDPSRIGETARIDRSTMLGRGDAEARSAVLFHRQRPSGISDGRLIGGARISRRQLDIVPNSDGTLAIENVGKCPLLVNGQSTSRAIARPGDVITLQNALVLLVIRRGAMRPLQSYPARLAFPFGGADPHGIVGETPAVWRLRDEIAFAAATTEHVLLHGRSGSGKELAARALHALSSRFSEVFLARNAATFPEGLIDAELFGNVKNYPNPGTPERRGLIGDADGGTLFLDEIGELPHSMQAHLLRVLDHGGEYQRLGDSRTIKSDFHFIAATNRPLEELKHDFLARFSTRLSIPMLEQRREDIPLLARHLLRRALEKNPAIGVFFDDQAEGPEPRLAPALMEILLRHEYSYDLRELERLLSVAVSTSPGRFIAATPEALEEARLPPIVEPQETAELTRGQIEEALSRAAGNVTAAAKALGLKNRFVLYRLMKRHGIASDALDE